MQDMARAAGNGGWPDAVVFDLDGTLIDSAGDIAGALNGALALRSLPPFEVEHVKQMIGGGIPKLVERALLAQGVSRDEMMPFAQDFVRIYAENLVVETRLFEGGLELLRALRAEGRRLAICTNKQHDLTLKLLAQLGLAGFFDSVVGERLGSPKKPDPAPLREVLHELGVEAHRAVMIGDSSADVGCARAAGVLVIVISHGYSNTPPEDLGADIVIRELSELPAALGELAKARVSG